MTEAEALDWIAVVLEQPPGRLQPETPRDQIAAWDSLGVLLLIAAYDGTFGIELTHDDLAGMVRVNDLVNVLRREGKLEPATLS